MQVFKLMEPHCRYTMNIGAAARMQFLSPGTVIEGSFTTGAACFPWQAQSSIMPCIADLCRARSWLEGVVCHVRHVHLDAHRRRLRRAVDFRGPEL